MGILEGLLNFGGGPAPTGFGILSALDWFNKDAQATSDRNDALRMGWGHLHDLRNRTTDAVESAHSDINNMFGQYANTVRGDATALSGRMARNYANLGATGNRLGNEMLSDMSTGHTNRINDFRGQYGNYEAGVNQAHQDRMNMGTAGNSDLSNAYSGQYARNMARLDNAGQQEAQDIRRDFRNAGSSIDADMANRGLSGTTVGATMKQGLARQQSDALGALNERVNQQKLNADLTMSNNALASQERGIDRSLGTYGDAINSQQSMGNNRFAYDTGLTGSALSSRENILGANVDRNMGTSLAGIQNQESMGRMLGSLNQQLGQQQMGERRTQLTEDRNYDMSNTDRLANLWGSIAGGIQGPSGSPLDMLGQLYMASQQPTTSGSSNDSWLSSAITGGAGLGGMALGSLGSGTAAAGLTAEALPALIGATAVMAMCVDVTHEVECDNGMMTPIEELSLFDKVRAADGRYLPVTSISLCAPHAEKPDHYLEMQIDGLPSPFRITIDHVIGGKPAGAWKVGDMSPTANGQSAIRRISQTEPFVGADITLEGCDEWDVMGIPVHSMCRLSDEMKAEVDALKGRAVA